MTINGLRKRATKATPGPWRVGYASGRCTIDHKHGGDACDYRVTGYENRDPSWHHVTQVKPIGSPTKDCQMIAGQYDHDAGGVLVRADSEYIAALPPEVALALLDVVDAATKTHRTLVARGNVRLDPLAEALAAVAALLSKQK